MRVRGLILILTCALLSGCWSRRELTDVSFAGIMGVDWTGEQYAITLTIVSPQKASEEKGGPTGRRTWTISEQAPSPDAAIAKLDQTLERSLTLSHVRTIVFGEEMARKGIGPTLDFMLRSVEIRPTAWIAVTNGLASELLKARPNQGILTEGPLGYQDAAQRRSSITPARRLTEAANILQEEGIDLTLPLFRTGDKAAPNAEQAEEEGALRGKEENANEVVYGGEGVFRGDKLVAWLTPEASRGHLWSLDRVVHGAVSVECPTPSSDERIVLRLRRSDGQTAVYVEQGKIRSRITVKVVADVNDITCDDPLVSDGDVTRLNQALAVRVKETIEKALVVARSTGSDMFGFGQNLYRHSPSAYLAREAHWDRVIQEMPVTVAVDARVVRLGHVRK
ncbi:MAG TPA: Ger(x)C family spore germination protein, partial [Symbiobacteriaceae bacterium]|nr:Ger(x)C family spore germination protein [Symbiobacteriaceae bacterium]